MGPAIISKAEVGGVALGLTSEAEVKAAYAGMAERLEADMAGAIVQEMVSGGVEMVAGATVDPIFGPLVLVGSGGVLVEMMNDIAFRIHPLYARRFRRWTPTPSRCWGKGPGS